MGERSPQREQILFWQLAIALLAILGLFAASAAQAAPEVRLRWVGKNGSAVAGSESVAAQVNDIIILEVEVIPDQNGIREFGFSVRWDADGKRELDLVNARLAPLPADTGVGYLTSALVAHTESTRDPGNQNAWGQFGSVRACVNPDRCVFDGSPALTVPVTIATLTFRVTKFSNMDIGDVEAGVFNSTETWVLDDGSAAGLELCPNPTNCTEIIFGTATVLPEPSLALLQLIALGSIGVLRRSRRD